MAVLDALMVPRLGSWTIEDATGTPIKVTVTYDRGDIKIGPLRAGNLKQEVVKVRGIDTFVVETEEEEVRISGSCYITDGTDATEKLIMDAFRKTGAFASGVSTLGANRPWALKFVYTQDSTAYGASADTVVTATKVCDLSGEFSEEDKGLFTWSGRIFNPSSTLSIT